MTSGATLSLIGVWFVLGQARIVFGSKMVEHRIDGVDASEALAFTRTAAAARRTASNYDERGQRLLPWYLAVTRAYWAWVAALGCWALYHY